MGDGFDYVLSHPDGGQTLDVLNDTESASDKLKANHEKYSFYKHRNVSLGF